MRHERTIRLLFFAGLLMLPATMSRAAQVTWTLDASQSFLALTIPNQPVSINGVPTGNAFFTNQGSSSGSWNVGNLAAIAGTLSTDWQPNSIRFRGGEHNLTAIDSGSYAPDFDNWEPGSQVFNPPDATDPAPFGGQINTTQTGILPVVFSDAARFAIRGVAYDLDSGEIDIPGGQLFAADEASFGIVNGELGLRGRTVSSFTVPSAFGSLDDMGFSLLGANFGGNGPTAVGSITSPDALQPLLRQLTLPLSLSFTWELYGNTLNGTADGMIVAYAMVPEPGTAASGMSGLVALLTLSVIRRRTKKGSYFASFTQRKPM